MVEIAIVSHYERIIVQLNRQRPCYNQLGKRSVRSTKTAVTLLGTILHQASSQSWIL